MTAFLISLVSALKCDILAVSFLDVLHWFIKSTILKKREKKKNYNSPEKEKSHSKNKNKSKTNINEKSKWITNDAGIARRVCGSELNILDYKVPGSPLKPAGGAQTESLRALGVFPPSP